MEYTVVVKRRYKGRLIVETNYVDATNSSEATKKVRGFYRSAGTGRGITILSVKKTRRIIPKYLRL